MQKEEIQTIRVKTIAESHQLMGIGKTKHPLFSIVHFEDIPQAFLESRVRLVFDFYQVAFKKDCPCKKIYGQTTYDFDEGVLSFFAPLQVSILEPGFTFPRSGWLLSIHPDFLRTFPLDKKMDNYGFFDYAVNEALILSEEEEKSIESIFQQMENEYQLPIDTFSQEIVITNLDLLLTYSNRYYNRQFITRKPNTSGLLTNVEKILNDYFRDSSLDKGLPTVTFLASKLNLSPKYLSDCLKQFTGFTAQQLIHEKLIEKAKEKLTTTNLSVSEIAYELGFEYSQSFSKLFKTKTKYSPLEFRQSFN